MVRIGSCPGGVTLATSKLSLVVPGVIPGPTSLRAEVRAEDGCPGQTGTPLELAVGHLLNHVKQEPTVAFFNATHQPAELVQKASLFA